MYNVFGRNSTPSFSLLWSVLRAGVSCKSEYIFLRHPAPADVHLTACGPPGKKFGHPWSKHWQILVSGSQAYLVEPIKLQLHDSGKFWMVFNISNIAVVLTELQS